MVETKESSRDSDIFASCLQEDAVVGDHVDESELSLIPDSNDTREMSVNTSEDSITRASDV